MSTQRPRLRVTRIPALVCDACGVAGHRVEAHHDALVAIGVADELLRAGEHERARLWLVVARKLVLEERARRKSS